MTDTYQGAKPRRVQLKRVKGWRIPPNTVKVDRTTRLGNPFFCHRKGGPGSHCRRVTPNVSYCCLDTYAEWLRSGLEGRDSCTGSVMAVLDAVDGYTERAALVKAVKAARGKNLACWCPLDQPCHADFLLELANQPETASRESDGGAA
jgi:Domain of unknown function (DUF4326)